LVSVLFLKSYHYKKRNSIKIKGMRDTYENQQRNGRKNCCGDSGIAWVSDYLVVDKK